MSAIDTDLLANLGLTREQSSGEKGKDRLGQGDFLKLMITQLENQDPFDPMESGEFLGSWPSSAPSPASRTCRSRFRT